MSCPQGSVPAITLSAATFAPQLTHGTTFRAGSYQITLRGVVANETTEPIDVRAVTAWVGGRPWQPRIAVSHVVPAQGSVWIVLTGSFRSSRPQRADVRTELAWQWRSAVLRPCGEEGLIQDN